MLKLLEKCRKVNIIFYTNLGEFKENSIGMYTVNKNIQESVLKKDQVGVI